jgi:hypothetical protein
MPFDQFVPRSFSPGDVQAYAPKTSGVYGISSAREWIFIGVTENIKDSLMGHLQELGTPLMNHKPTGFVFEICDGARRLSRQDRLVSEYEPICNRRSVPQS